MLSLSGTFLTRLTLGCNGNKYQSKPTHPSSVSSPLLKERKVMTALLIIISFIYVCPAASSGARTPRDTHTSTVSQMHTWSQNFFTYSETRRATRPGPSIIHMPESIDFGVQGCSSAQQSEDITVTRGHDPQWILKCFKATAARLLRNTRDLLNCVHYKCKVVNGDSQLRALLPQVVHLQASTNLKSVKLEFV